MMSRYIGSSGEHTPKRPLREEMVQNKLVEQQNFEKGNAVAAGNKIAEYNRNPSKFSHEEKMTLYAGADKYGFSTYTGREKEEEIAKATKKQAAIAAAAGFIDEALLFGLVSDDWMAKKIGGDVKKTIRNAGYAGMGASFLIPGMGAISGLSKVAKGVKLADKAIDAVKVIDKANDLRKSVNAIDKTIDGMRTADAIIDIQRLSKKGQSTSKVIRDIVKASTKTGKKVLKTKPALAKQAIKLKKSEKILKEAFELTNKLTKTSSQVRSFEKTMGTADDIRKIAEAGQGKFNVAGTLFGSGQRFFKSPAKALAYPGVGIEDIARIFPQGSKRNITQMALRLGYPAARIYKNTQKNTSSKSAWEQYQDQKAWSAMGGGAVPTQ